MNKDSFFTFIPVSYVVTQGILEKHTENNLQPDTTQHFVGWKKKNATRGCLVLFSYPDFLKTYLDCLVLLKELCTLQNKIVLIFSITRVLNILPGLHKYKLSCIHNVDMRSSKLTVR